MADLHLFLPVKFGTLRWFMSPSGNVSSSSLASIKCGFKRRVECVLAEKHDGWSLFAFSSSSPFFFTYAAGGDDDEKQTEEEEKDGKSQEAESSSAATAPDSPQKRKRSDSFG